MEEEDSQVIVQSPHQNIEFEVMVADIISYQRYFLNGEMYCDELLTESLSVSNHGRYGVEAVRKHEVKPWKRDAEPVHQLL